MQVLSLDLSSKSSGYAIFQDGTLVTSGVITASSTDVITRIQKITKALKETISEYKIDKVIMEEVLPKNGFNQKPTVWKALTWTQASVCFMLHDSFPKAEKEFIMPNSWRSKVGIHTGAGVKRDILKKADIDKVKEIFNKICGDDEADAILIGYSSFQTVKYAW